MTIDATLVVAICMSLFGICVGLGAFIARSVINRVGILEGEQKISIRTADLLEGRVLVIEGKVYRLEDKEVDVNHPKGGAE